MANHSSATVRETPHVNETGLKRRAQSILNDRTIDPQSRANGMIEAQIAVLLGSGQYHLR